MRLEKCQNKTKPYICAYNKSGPWFLTSWHMLWSFFCVQRVKVEGWYLWKCWPLNCLNPVTYLCLSKTRTWISNVICHGLFCVQWVQLRWEVTVHFVDIGEIIDHHCLNFLFIILYPSSVFGSDNILLRFKCWSSSHHKVLVEIQH